TEARSARYSSRSFGSCKSYISFDSQKSVAIGASCYLRCDSASAASDGQPAGERTFAAASLGGRLLSQSRPIKRKPLIPSDSGEASHWIGAAITSGLIRLSRPGKPGGKNAVSAGPPGTRMLAVTPVPSSSFAHAAVLASSPDLAAP